MIKSMTGYGVAEGELNGVTYAVEIKAVNNRYFKTRVKLPEPVAFLEDAVEKLLRDELERGSINYTLRLKDVSANVFFAIDEQALASYIERLKAVAAAANVESSIDLAALMSLPGMLVPVLPDKETAAKVREVVLKVSGEAISRVNEMRQREGAALAADVGGHCEAIKVSLDKIRPRVGEVIGQYHKKLEKRVNALLAAAKLELNEETLAREVAVYAERCDIAEELSRLDSHLEQFAASCESDGQAGRRLDFISQEMLREANTIASKSLDTEIVQCVVEIKCCIDLIKEQVQNVK